ncbi:MAG: PIN domain-containing protein [Candidatus Eremiobacteraeota bacterium]|nr:PIN domain-containing protein [Candidatus Eremiobacteraeota bacterium]
MTALDTNVIVDLAEGNSEVAERALTLIERAAARGSLVVCGVVYAELCAAPNRTPDDVAAALNAAQIGIDTDMPLPLWNRAGTAYAAYAARRRRSRAKEPRRIAADFIIGAHAEAVGMLLTSDAEFYRRAFPELQVIDIRA